MGLLANRFRTLLTMSGIIVGVAALIATLAVGRGSRDSVEKRLESMGRDAIYINASWRPIEGVAGRRKFYRLTMADWHAIQELHDVRKATPMLWNSQQVIYRSADTNPTVLGVTTEFMEIFHWGVEQGRTFTEDEIVSGKNVCLLGHSIFEKLFGSEDPVGKIVRIGRMPFEVVGVLEERGQDGVAQDEDVLLPITTAQIKIFHSPRIHQIIAEPRVSEQMDAVAEQIVRLMCFRNNASMSVGEMKPFEARTSQQMLKNARETSNTFAILIFLTAALSLVVGGIGIMNTMMMSVYERTKEIGVRMAIGARSSDILWLFILESLIL
jgi:putative ABC transport system permease protein